MGRSTSISPETISLLERCLHDIYEDRGWNLRTNRNDRLADGDDSSMAYLTLSDLIAKVATVIGALGYDDKVTGDLRAALTTRLEALRIDSKGAMLDVARSLPIADLLSGPTVVELESLGDEGDRAFVTALLLIADQVPARLAPDVIKNTTLKIAHRIVSADDRAILGAAMAMERDQARALVTLAVGEAVVFGADDDSPLLVRVPLAKNPLSPTPPGRRRGCRPDAIVAGLKRQ